MPRVISLTGSGFFPEGLVGGGACFCAGFTVTVDLIFGLPLGLVKGRVAGGAGAFFSFAIGYAAWIEAPGCRPLVEVAPSSAYQTGEWTCRASSFLGWHPFGPSPPLVPQTSSTPSTSDESPLITILIRTVVLVCPRLHVAWLR